MKLFCNVVNIYFKKSIQISIDRQMNTNRDRDNLPKKM